MKVLRPAVKTDEGLPVSSDAANGVAHTLTHTCTYACTHMNELFKMDLQKGIPRLLLSCHGGSGDAAATSCQAESDVVRPGRVFDLRR